MHRIEPNGVMLGEEVDMLTPQDCHHIFTLCVKDVFAGHGVDLQVCCNSMESLLERPPC